MDLSSPPSGALPSIRHTTRRGVGRTHHERRRPSRGAEGSGTGWHRVQVRLGANLWSALRRTRMLSSRSRGRTFAFHPRRLEAARGGVDETQRFGARRGTRTWPSYRVMDPSAVVAWPVRAYTIKVRGRGVSAPTEKSGEEHVDAIDTASDGESFPYVSLAGASSAQLQAAASATCQ